VVAQHKQWCDPRLFFSLSRLGSQRREIVAIRGVAPGGAGGAMAPPDFGRSINPMYLYQGRTVYTHLIDTGTPEFLDLPTALQCNDLLLVVVVDERDLI
jgi:hypothetical protein